MEAKKEHLSNENGRFTPEFYYTEKGSAERIAEYYGKKMRFCYEIGKWYVFNGKYWELDPGHLALTYAGEVMRGLLEAKNAKRGKLLAGPIERLERRSYIANALFLAQAKLPITVSQLDGDPMLLNVPNGTIELDSGRLRPHAQDDYITKMCMIKYDPGSACPRWNSFLEEVFKTDSGEPDYDLIYYIQKVVGYSLTGSVQEEAIFILHGFGANGKSTFLDVLQKLFEDYTANPRPELITRAKNKSTSFNEDAAMLRGAHLAIVQEINDQIRLDEAMVKQLTTPGKMTAAYKHKSAFSFRPTHKLFVALNHLPEIRNTDDGIWRRLHLIPFKQSFIGREDRELPGKLWQERQGILNWCIEGAALWAREGLQKPAAVDQYGNDYKSDQDVIGGFIYECCDTVDSGNAGSEFVKSK